MSATAWKGWAFGNTALYLEQPDGSDYVGLYLQQDDDIRQMGVFVDPDAASQAQEWLDAALTAVGTANLELTRLLQARGDRG